MKDAKADTTTASSVILQEGSRRIASLRQAEDGGYSAGWYPQPDGEQLFWDGQKYTMRWVGGAPVPLTDSVAASQQAIHARGHNGKKSRAEGALQILCPHCQVRGQVQTKQLKVKRGVSGGKATGALLTGGVSILVTGLSRKEAATKATCMNCHVTWLM